MNKKIRKSNLLLALKLGSVLFQFGKATLQMVSFAFQFLQHHNYHHHQCNSEVPPVSVPKFSGLSVSRIVYFQL